MLGCKYETRRIHLEIVFFVSIFLHFSGNFRLRLILMVLSLCFTIDFLSLCSDLFAFLGCFVFHTLSDGITAVLPKTTNSHQHTGASRQNERIHVKSVPFCFRGFLLILTLSSNADVTLHPSYFISAV